MEDLVHGLINVALGRDGGRRDGDRAQDSPAIDQASRSTWAEVVSSGQDENEESFSGYSRKEGGEGTTDGGWETVGHKKERHPSRRSEEEEVGGGWQTAGREKHHQKKIPVDNWHKYKQPPVEQEYIHEADHGLNIEPSREELAELSAACSKLWDLDSNRLIPGKDYEIDCGEGKKVYQKEDVASESLFRWLNDDIFRRPTYGRFCSLLDNYNPNEGYKEVVTPQEKHEQDAFIEEISRTAPIRYLHKYLVSNGIAPEDYKEFKRMMINLWFGLHGRGGGSSCSSAFEHVFVGEIKGRGKNEVSGFHNWIQFYMEEAKGNVDYQGYVFPRRRGQCPDSETQLLTLQFEWNGILKSVSSSFIGVSPEFEIALYTLCFFMGGEDNHILLGPYAVNIKCYRLGNDRIGSVFPIAES
ncbi:poly(U)-specific endoribonuclease-B isoform X2 [Asparagus officinalis]|uniref:poly(U)-specific endoribonuclease-B isoform X2 n=1 Tax=Asparagus officinalis TaxID=4686 RepID=UPI00098E09B9|nr:poly(U)-specific endoribonuclease-B isoform X2 [Asparagus officinalis]